MNRQEKASLIESLKDDFTKSKASFLVNYKGLSVAQMQTLRREVRAKGGRVRIAKNRLIKRAVGDVDGLCDLEIHLRNQLGVVFAADGFTEVAKVLSDFSREHPAFTLVAGCLEAELIGKEKIAQLALLPSREVLLGQVCGALNAPLSGLSNVLSVLMLRLLWVLKQVAEKKQ